MRMCAGDMYEGGWQHGLEDGVGTFIAADGSTYYGSWRGGQLDGQGVYKPASPSNARCAGDVAGLDGHWA
jgi:hypothetical protein